MQISYKVSCLDSSTPVIDILAESINDAFELGKIFQQLTDDGCKGWELDHGIRIPILQDSEPDPK
jgi:hypothetical protein